jgi:RHS repeat-associated protein
MMAFTLAKNQNFGRSEEFGNRGSSRVMMRGSMPNSTYPDQVVEYYNYQPFGQAIESWGSYATPYKFTGKERDQHSTFDYDYFGARYYDPRIGQFSSVDAAGQFASGYVYGGNNPVCMSSNNSDTLTP